MRGKGFLAALAAFSVLVVFILSARFSDATRMQLDTVAVNDTVEALADNWVDLQQGGGLPALGYQLDYAVIDNVGNLIADTRRGLSESINTAIRNRDTIVDIKVNGEVVGKVIFHNDTARILEENRARTITTSVIIVVILLLLSAAYAFYLHVTLVRPFEKMKDYAGRIAAGNLDIPLPMDRNNVFGAFTESFDLMREELHLARENERKADRSKKELVASLSHDIKTPVASIKAVTEVLAVTATDEELRSQLAIINAKAEQINTLVTDLFHATLEELQALTVNVADVPSTELPTLIRNADYQKRVGSFTIPSCILSADMQRLQQVFDNIISNSYKYAGTDIEIEAAFEKEYLVIRVIDFGAGVSKEELPLLFHKFYRGKDADSQSGYGLGLYISKYLLTGMGGGIRCENRPNGFAVELKLRLSL